MGAATAADADPFGSAQQGVGRQVRTLARGAASAGKPSPAHACGNEEVQHLPDFKSQGCNMLR